MSNIKTKGNYKVENFKKLDTPIERGILEPHIYSGTVVAPKLYAEGNETYEITWDKNGKCSNWSRSDCFIDVSEIKRELRKKI